MNIPFLHRKVSSFHAAALILGSAALLSKLLGLFRDRLLAATFGAGDTLDAYYAAFQIPDVLFTIFLVGAASAAVLPVFLDYERHSEKDAEEFVSNLIGVFSLSGLALAVLLFLAAPVLMRVAAPGFIGAKLALATRLTRVMIFNTLFLGVAGILSSVLQARHRFIVFALPPIVYNIGIILGILFLVPVLGPQGLGYGVLLGGILQVLIQLPTLFEMGFRLRPRLDFREPGLLKVGRTSFPRVAALSMNQLTLTVLAAIASLFSAGSLAVFRLAVNLVYVPVGLFGVSYALAMFPKLSSASLSGETEEFKRHVALGLRNIFFWTLPFVSLFIVLRAHIVRVVLGSGFFDWRDTRLVAAMLAVLALAIISEGLLPLVLRAFYALGKTREPLLWDIAGSIATVAFTLGFAALFLAKPAFLTGLAKILRIADIASPQILAVALGFSLGSIANIFFLLYSLRRVVRKTLGVRLGLESEAWLTMAGAALLAGIAAYFTLLPFPSIVRTNTFLGIALQGCVAAVVGFFVYSFILWRENNPEIRGVAESIRGRLLTLKRTPQVYETEKLDGESPR